MNWSQEPNSLSKLFEHLILKIMPEENSILFLGDVVPYKPFRFKNNLKTIINLECPIIEDGTPVTGKINLNVGKNHLGKTFGKNLLAANLGNNHILDYGLGGLDSTIRETEAIGAAYFGINLPGDHSHNPLVLDHNGTRIALMSAVSESTAPVVEFDDFNYINVLDSPDFFCRLGKVREQVRRIIVYMHWGTPESSYPDKETIITARKLIDAGADIIIGSHAHAPQAVEKYKDGIIAYNLGNFIMPSFRNIPSFYDDDGNALSFYSKKLMLWNRISWGLIVNMETMEFIVKKYIFLADRILELTTTPFDKYQTLHSDSMTDNFENKRQSHLKNRLLRRRVRDFIYSPHMPESFNVFRNF